MRAVRQRRSHLAPVRNAVLRARCRVDVREPAEWQTGHIAGARLVPLSQLRVDPKGALPRDNIVFVCAKGGRSATASAIAEEIGKTHVQSMTGGMDAWQKAGLPIVVPEQPSAARKQTNGAPRVAF